MAVVRGFPTYWDQRETFDHYRWNMYSKSDGGYDFDGPHEPSESEFSMWSIDTFPDYDIIYSLGRREYKYMDVSACPLCNGECMERLKWEVEGDVDGLKWRFVYDDYLNNINGV